ncbi:DUF3540 domain-containing protein [Thiocapsa sp. UBA6158]|jgi:hypothetical protein|uniref:DUF3540 domain-containing protein n=1 Tax=Thiocapsa sp. UBA6158 TaxID=1947692 RepID=UPI0025EBEF28|nr:DUF3540 domain-containing protein [Thiocapsa sp. UBA6158]
MDALRPDQPSALRPQPMHLEGEVLSVEEGATCTIQTATGVLRARRAVSCLVWPEVGDRVLVAQRLNDETFLIAILERRAAVPLRLVLPGETRVEVAEGAGLSLRVEGPLALGSDSRLSAESPKVSVRAERLTLVGGRFELIAREALAALRSSRLIGDLVEATAKRLNLSLDQSRRRVRDLDQVHAGSVEIRAEQVARLHADTLLADARRLVKIDGEQIHLG